MFSIALNFTDAKSKADRQRKRKKKNRREFQQSRHGRYLGGHGIIPGWLLVSGVRQEIERR